MCGNVQGSSEMFRNVRPERPGAKRTHRFPSTIGWLGECSTWNIFVSPGIVLPMRRFLTAFPVVLLFAASAFAQTGAELLIKPLMDENEVWESGGEGLFIAN